MLRGLTVTHTRSKDVSLQVHILRNWKHTLPYPRTLSANPPLLFRQPAPLKPLRFLRCSSSVAVDSVTADNNTESLSCVDQSHHHPWPEWVSFVDRLKTKGYLTESPDASAGGVGVTTTADSVYRNMTLVKNACLGFARDRYDIFKWVCLITVIINACLNSLFGWFVQRE